MTILNQDTSRDFIPRLRLLLREIDYHYVAPLPPSVDFLQSFHDWIHDTLGPVSSWTTAQLDVLEETTSSIIERAYPFADTEMKSVLARLTALAILIDDSVDNDATYDEIGSFAHLVYLGESQSSGVLGLYHDCIKELSHAHEGDAVLRGLAVMPWITYVDACLLEKRMMTVDPEIRASPWDMGYDIIAQQQRHSARSTTPGAMFKFPYYLRHKSGIGEAYASAIFKATKTQELPLSRYVMALPDITFYTNVMNDLLSFYKEELAGETANLIHLQTQSLKERKGTGACGEWTLSDTFSLLCDEVRDAAKRVDEFLKLEDCERIVREGLDGRDMGLSDADISIALQWKGWRDGYISWHLECRRYKLDFLRPARFEA